MPTRTLLLAAVLIFAAAPHAALAQTQPAAQTRPHATSQPDFSSAADQVIAALNHANAKHVAVFDFIKPLSPDWNPVGQQLAADFRASLEASHSRKFKIANRADIVKWMQRNSLTQDDLVSESVGIWTTRDAKIDGWVFGTLNPNTAQIVISFNVYTGDRGRSVQALSIAISRTPDLDALIDRTPPPPQPFADMPEAGKNGISVVKCVYCPQAAFSQQALGASLQGTVYLLAVVGVNGTVERVAVLHGLPLGLSDQAVADVKTWRFEPARDADGKAVAVRQLVEVQFRLFR
jgi:hypothetical protein